MIADGRVLFIKCLSDGESFSVDFVVESDGLIGGPVNTFARDPTNQIGEFRRVSLMILLINSRLKAS